MNVRRSDYCGNKPGRVLISPVYIGANLCTSGFFIVKGLDKSFTGRTYGNVQDMKGVAEQESVTSDKMEYSR